MRNPVRPAVIVPTQAVDAEELTAQCAAAAATGAVDAIEWRIDPLLAQTAVAEAAIGDGAHPEDLFAEAATRTEEVLRWLRTRPRRGCRYFSPCAPRSKEAWSRSPRAPTPRCWAVSSPV